MESPATSSAFFDSAEFREQLERAIEASGLSTEPEAAAQNVLNVLREAAGNDGSEIWRTRELGVAVLALARAGGLSLGVADGITTAVEAAVVEETVETVGADEEHTVTAESAPVETPDTNNQPLPPRQGDDPVTRAMENARSEVRAHRRGSTNL